MRAFFALLLFFTASAAHAGDILFLDMNASFHEIKAAKEAARRAGRGFVAFPPMTDAQRKDLYEANFRVEHLAARYAKACQVSGSPACLEHEKKSVAARAYLETTRKKFTVTQEKLQNFLGELDASGRKFNSVIVSGHDGTGSISGRLGSVGDRALADLFQQSTALKDSMRSLYLWGCYTASPSSIILNWKSQFPNLNMIAGFDGRAPLSDKPAGWKYLTGVIAREEKLHAITDSKKLKAALRKIPFANMVHSAIATCNAYANQKEDFLLSDYTKKCDELADKLKAREAEYECYLRADQAGCEDPPTDLANGALRQFYQIVQDAEACRDISKDPIFRFNRASAMNLLFYRGVIANLVANHRGVLDESDEMLKKLGAPDSLKLGDLDKVSRHEGLARLDQLLDFVRRKLPDFTTDPAKITPTPEMAQLHTLRNLQISLSGVVAELGERCVPFNWHEKGAQEKSSCLAENELGRAGVAATLASSDLRDTIVRGTVRDMKNTIEKRSATPGAERDADNLLFDANLERLSAFSIGNDHTRARAAARVAWAAKVKELAAEKVIDPVGDRRARALQYTYREKEMAAQIRDLDKSIADLPNAPFVEAAKLPLAKKMMEDLRASYRELQEIAALGAERQREDLGAEKIAENERRLREATARLKTSLVAAELARNEQAHAMYQETFASEEFRLGGEGIAEYRGNLEREAAQVDAAIAELKSDPDGFVKRYVAENIDALPKPGL